MIKLTGVTNHIVFLQVHDRAPRPGETTTKGPDFVLRQSFLTVSERAALIESLRAFSVESWDPLGPITEDQTGNKLTKITFPNDPSWRYFSNGLNSKRAYDRRGWEVRFCWSTKRNAAGYFLSWIERVPPANSQAKSKEPQRTKWAARKSRKRAKALALRRAISHSQKGLIT